MTKKDFQAMADAVQEARRQSKPLDHATIDFVAIKLADACAAQYNGAYSFKRGKFLAACGVQSGNP